jgi:hypothetical protein
VYAARWLLSPRRYRSAWQASQARSSCGAGEAGNPLREQKAPELQVRPGQPSPAFRPAGPRDLDVIGGESIHRVTAAAFAAARPGIWPGGVHRAPAASAGCAAMRAP